MQGYHTYQKSRDISLNKELHNWQSSTGNSSVCFMNGQLFKVVSFSGLCVNEKLDKVDDIPLLAGCCCSYLVGVASSSAPESALSPDALAGLALMMTTLTASLSLPIVSPTLTEVLGLAISHDGRFRYGSL